MPSPQLENGYVRIANEIVEALAKVHLSSHESQVMWAVLRKTYGFNKKTNPLSCRYVALLTGLDFSDVAKALRALWLKGLLERNTESRPFQYGLQKDHSHWKNHVGDTTDKRVGDTTHKRRGRYHPQIKTKNKDIIKNMDRFKKTFGKGKLIPLTEILQ